MLVANLLEIVPSIFIIAITARLSVPLIIETYEDIKEFLGRNDDDIN